MADYFLSIQWAQLLSQYTTIWLGLSGGLDSTALLDAVLQHPQLHSKLRILHVNHGLSIAAPQWEAHCRQTCQRLQLPFFSAVVSFDQSKNIEEHARIARYDFFSQWVQENDCLLLAHHADDQAETLFLNLFRGCGVEGLRGMLAITPWQKASIIRPFLAYSREQIAQYAAQQKLQWIEDESNEVENYSRNYLRKQVMPLLKQRWPALLQTMGRTALHCQQAEKNLHALATIDCPSIGLPGPLPLTEQLLHLDRTRVTNVLRVWLKKQGVSPPTTQQMEIFMEALIAAKPDANPQLQLGEVILRRFQKKLYLTKELPHFANKSWDNFPEQLALGPKHFLIANRVNKGLVLPVGATIRVAFRAQGEQFFWHGQHKKLKKLWQLWQVPPWLRDQIPLIYINEELAAVVGYAMSDLFYQENASNAYEIKLVG